MVVTAVKAKKKELSLSHLTQISVDSLLFPAFTSNPVTGPAIPPICGGNDGLHLYMDAGAYYDDQSTFSIVVGESGLDWKILVFSSFSILQNLFAVSL